MKVGQSLLLLRGIQKKKHLLKQTIKRREVNFQAYLQQIEFALHGLGFPMSFSNFISLENLQCLNRSPDRRDASPINLKQLRLANTPLSLIPSHQGKGQKETGKWNPLPLISFLAGKESGSKEIKDLEGKNNRFVAAGFILRRYPQPVKFADTNRVNEPVSSKLLNPSHVGEALASQKQGVEVSNQVGEAKGEKLKIQSSRFISERIKLDSLVDTNLPKAMLQKGSGLKVEGKQDASSFTQAGKEAGYRLILNIVLQRITKLISSWVNLQDDSSQPTGKNLTSIEMGTKTTPRREEKAKGLGLKVQSSKFKAQSSRLNEVKSSELKLKNIQNKLSKYQDSKDQNIKNILNKASLKEEILTKISALLKIQGGNARVNIQTPLGEKLVLEVAKEIKTKGKELRAKGLKGIAKQEKFLTLKLFSAKEETSQVKLVKEERIPLSEFENFKGSVSRKLLNPSHVSEALASQKQGVEVSNQVGEAKGEKLKVQSSRFISERIKLDSLVDTNLPKAMLQKGSGLKAKDSELRTQISKFVNETSKLQSLKPMATNTSSKEEPLILKQSFILVDNKPRRIINIQQGKHLMGPNLSKQKVDANSKLNSQNLTEISLLQKPNFKSSFRKDRENSPRWPRWIDKPDLTITNSKERLNPSLPKRIDKTVLTIPNLKVNLTWDRGNLSVKNVSSLYPEQEKQVIEQILDKIYFLKAHNQNKAKILLKPSSLGNLKINLSMGKEALSLQIQVSNLKASQIIQDGFLYLKESLRKEGIFLKEFDVSLNQNSDFGQGKEQAKNFPSPHRNLFSSGINTLFKEKKSSNIRVNQVPYYINYLA
ncbi:flagellar hook-length control protein FliK [Candidatus Aerophobetes bacterium]|nr:flagellar hook-length control protein FliK [Candidatus Aerophobetes bacterium]